MVVLMAGATGSIGRALARVLRREGHQVIAAVRSVQRARNALGPEIELIDVQDRHAMRDAIERADALVNLAGEGIADRPWTASRKRALRASRVDLTHVLSDYVVHAVRPPRVFVSASAIGIYPDTEASVYDERDAAGNGFLAQLCKDWEAAALRSESSHTRVVCLRIGVVLDSETGALAKLLPVFRLGLGGTLGSGKQYFSWVHLDDLLQIVLFSLCNEGVRGPVNATAPEPVTNRELTRALSVLVDRPAVVPVPAFVVRLLMGARAELMLKSQRVVPTALERAGYRFRYRSIAQAFAEIKARLAESTRVEPYVSRAADEPNGATQVLTQTTVLAAPLSDVFPFFARAQNLAWITPPWMGFAIKGAVPENIREGTIIEYDIRLGPLPLRWRTRIAAFEPGERFIDNQERGPYSLWWHEHRFEAHEGGTRMVDRVLIRLPFGRLGDLFAGAIIRSTLRRIFGYRAQAMAHRFGSPTGSLSAANDLHAAQ